MRGGARSLRMARPLLSPAASDTEVGTDAVGALSTSGTSAESRMAHRVPRPEHECRRVRVRRFVSLSVRICSPQAPHSVAALGPAKSRIAFLGQVRFGDITKLTDDGMRCSFALPYRIESPRFVSVDEVAPGWLVHTLFVQSPDELDEEAQDWIRASYRQMRMRERLTRTPMGHTWTDRD